MKRRTFLDILAKSIGSAVAPTPIISRCISPSGNSLDKAYVALEELQLLRSGVSVQTHLSSLVQGIPHKAYSLPQVYTLGHMKSGSFDLARFERVRAKAAADPTAYFEKFLTADKTLDQQVLAYNIAECKDRETFSQIPTSRDLANQVKSVEKTLAQHDVTFSDVPENDFYRDLPPELKKEFRDSRSRELCEAFDEELSRKYNFERLDVVAQEKGYTTQFARYDELVSLHPNTADEWLSPKNYSSYFLQITDTLLTKIHQQLSGHFFSSYPKTSLTESFDLTENELFIENYLVNELYEPNGQKLIFEEDYMKQSWIDGAYQGLVKLQDRIKSFTKENPEYNPHSLDTFLDDVYANNQSHNVSLNQEVVNVK